MKEKYAVETPKESRKIENKLHELEERYSLLVEHANDGIAIIQDRLLKYVNPCLAEISGYSSEELIDSPFGIYVHPDELPKVVNFYMRRMAGEEIPSEYETVFIDKGGSEILVEINAHRISYQGKTADLVIIRDITASKRAEKLQSSLQKISEALHSVENLEEFYHAIHKIVCELMPAQANFYIALFDKASEMIDFPYSVNRFQENPGPQKPGRGLIEYVLRHGEPLLATPEKIVELGKRGEVESVELPTYYWLGVPLKTRDQSIGVLAVKSYGEGVRYSEEDKRILMLVSEQIVRAIECKRHEDSLEEMESILRKIHHRVKNNLQLILSLVRLQSSQLKDIETVDMFDTIQSRIKSMALIHETLYQSEDLGQVDFSDYLVRMASQLFINFKDMKETVRLNLDVGKVYLDIERAIPCGLILNELLSNSLRHAFPDGRKGEIFVRMHTDKKGKHTLIVGDTGIGFPKGLNFRTTETLGLQLVTDSVKQMGGAIRLRRGEGTEIRIVF